MAYGAVHAGFFENAKYLAALERDPQAIVLYVWGLAYCHDQLSDGVIPTIAVRRRVELRKPLALAAILCDAGLWEPRPGGWLVHDWHDHNPSLERIKEKRTLAAKRQAAWRENHRDETSGRYVRNALRDASSNALRNAAFTITNTITTRSGSTEDRKRVETGAPKRYKGIPESTATAEELRGIAEANRGH